ncbi:serine/threonine-protein kinase ATG1c isoform X1 [Juglans microcarpa x Juglans regia]|uniref:serine/threonine-protein kinase ATG1c isoform X1 n=1 Tax=Juglans microcarpa x Juglans regia TaxID=2249226 RepID=UPI001B7E63CA|nr:serine/threonine-protein kinase ATG1c isoform X1 [Juglans microcarpa x Juglans regia]
MAQASRVRVVGEYLVGRQIGSGSFSVVWHARHRVHGTEVAIKEIATGRLNKKLQESLMSEIFILKRINHPNIIRLHDIIEVPGKIHLVLEYCRGGDLSMYIQRQGRVPEATAKQFMQQLVAGLQILRENSLIHRDLKPQNLLLSASDNNSVLKIADFGFARSLQPRGLAETLCGSPLYMAPEIMQLQKYDAKADLWSVGAILFQLVTGKTPFTGNNQIQLLQNIMKSNELQFPPDIDLSSDCKDLCQKLLRRNPVERLTFEEFFNHPYLSQKQPAASLGSRRSSRVVDEFPMSDCDPVRNMEENSQEDCLPFFLDDDSGGPEGSPSFLRRRSSPKSTHGFSLDTKFGRREVASPPKNVNLTSGYGSATDNLESRRPSNRITDPLPFFLVGDSGGPEGSPSFLRTRSSVKSTYGFSLDTKVGRREAASANSNNVNLTSGFGSVTDNLESTSSRLDSRRPANRITDPLTSTDQRSPNTQSRAVVDSLELSDQDYVIVSGHPMDVSSSSACASKPGHSIYKSGSSPQASVRMNTTVSAPMPIIGTESSSIGRIGSLESQSSALGISQGSMEMGDALGQPSTHCTTRIKSLQHCASAIKELLNEKIEADRHLEAFSIQLVILAIWKQALHICHTQAASAMEGSPSQETPRYRSTSKKYGSPDTEVRLDVCSTQLLEDISSQIERDFLLEVEHAEGLAKVIEPGNTEMPDAMETIFESALAFGRSGGVEELMGNMENAAGLYSKAVRLLVFLLVEAPSLILNPPFSLTNSDRYRLQTYIDIINNRHGYSRSQRMALLKCDDQHCPP